MGWKTIKEHYQIQLIIQVGLQGNIYIGVELDPECIVITPKGTLIKKFDNTLWIGERKLEELHRIYSAMVANPVLLQELFAAEDTFSAHTPIYTWDETGIVEDFCEQLGYPNVTHRGFMMYENLYHQDRRVVLQWALEDASREAKFSIQELSQLSDQMQRTRANYDQALERIKVFETEMENTQPNALGLNHLPQRHRPTPPVSYAQDSIEGRIHQAIKCLNLHWVSHDGNRFDYAIEGLEQCLVELKELLSQKETKETCNDGGKCGAGGYCTQCPNTTSSVAVSHDSVNEENVLAYTEQLETAIAEVMSGKRSPSKIPVEPLVALIQFAKNHAKVAS